MGLTMIRWSYFSGEGRVSHFEVRRSPAQIWRTWTVIAPRPVSVARSVPPGRQLLERMMLEATVSAPWQNNIWTQRRLFDIIAQKC